MGEDSRLAVGIDLGGTHARVAVVDAGGRILARRKEATRPEEGPQAVIRRLARAVRDLLAAPPAERAAAALVGVGLATPGPVDARRGVIVTTPNLPGWREVPAAGLLAAELGLPVRHLRDANAALLGEAWLGAARGCRDVVLLTLGTGIGGAALVGGRLLGGRDGFAGEFGHLTVDPDGPACGCGNRGCLEALASGTAIRRRTGRDGREVFAAARGGEPEALAVVSGVADALGMGLAGLANAFNPERIVLGGGMAAEWDLLVPRAVAEMRRRAFAPVTAGLEVVPARLGDDAGVLGAACAVLKEDAGPGQ